MKKAILLIGFQNDYFARDGILREVVEESSVRSNIIENTVNLIRKDDDTLFISTPILFSENYSELEDPVGILKVIKEKGAFKKGTPGAETIDEIKQFGDKVLEVPGKIGLNAFAKTQLFEVLKKNEITDVYLAGTVASVCIDSTGRSAYDHGFKVSVIADCISGRTIFEKDYYVENVFPLYAQVVQSKELN